MNREGRSDTDHGFPRRDFLRLLALGGAVLLEACGGAAPTATLTRSSATLPPAPPSATATSQAAMPTAAATPVETPQAGVKSPTPEVASSELARMLELVPRHQDLLRATSGIWFVDTLAHKRAHGFENVTSMQAYQTLSSSERKRLVEVFAGMPNSESSGAHHAANPTWQETLGYNYWQLEREIYAGDPPRTWSRLEGAFDVEEIARKLTRRGYSDTTYRGARLLSRGRDGELGDLKDPVTRLTLARLNRVVLDSEGISTTPFTALAQAGIDAASGATQTLVDDPDYAALAGTLPQVTAAAMLPASVLYTQPRAATDAARLHPYRVAGLGTVDDGTSQRILIALVYERAADAEADAPVLRRRVAAYELRASRHAFTEYVTVGRPQITSSDQRTVLVLPLSVKLPARRFMWREMLFQRDLLFLGR